MDRSNERKRKKKNISDALKKCTKFCFKIDYTEIYNSKVYRQTHTYHLARRKMWINYFPFEMREQSLVWHSKLKSYPNWMEMWKMKMLMMMTMMIMRTESKQWHSKESCKCLKSVVSCICAAENFNKSEKQSTSIIAYTRIKTVEKQEFNVRTNAMNNTTHYCNLNA